MTEVELQLEYEKRMGRAKRKLFDMGKRAEDLRRAMLNFRDALLESIARCPRCEQRYFRQTYQQRFCSKLCKGRQNQANYAMRHGIGRWQKEGE